MKKNYLNFKKASFVVSFMAFLFIATGVKAQCTVTIVSSPSNSICSGATATLTANGALTYTWSTGAVSNTIAVNPTITTTYSVVGTTSAACTNSAVITVSVIGTPTITAVASSPSICINRTVSITASGATNYTLSTGAANGASFTPTATATYTISGANACFTSSTSITVTVNPLPTLTVSASSATLCSGATVTLSVNGNGASYLWATGSVTTTTIAVTPIPSSTGTSIVTGYSVTATSAAGCTATAVNNLTIVTTPVIAPIASPPSICTGASATLQVSGATNYTWIAPSGSISSSSSVVVTPTTVTVITPITYTITKSNANCINTQVITLTVNPLPALFAVVNPAEVCAGSQATLTAGGATNYTWTPATNPANGANVMITPTVTTTYTYVGYNGTCSATSTITVPVSPIPTITIASPTAICLNSIGSLTATGASSYSWTSSSSSVVYTGPVIAVTPTVTTSYAATGALIYTLSSNSSTYACTNSATQLLFVTALPVITVTPVNYTICLGKTATITASANNNPNSYLWDANTGNATTSIVHITPTVSTIYTVTVSNNSTGCINTKTASVHVFNQSFTVVPTATAICLTSTITLHASGALNYIWAPGNFNTTSITISPTVNTTYTVTGTSTVINTPSVLSCQATYTIPITVNPNPTVTAMTTNSVICRGETSTLTAAGATNYTWSPAAGSGSLVIVNSTDTPNYVNGVTYTVIGADGNNCKRTATVEVITSGCLGIQQLAGVNRDVLIYPNPNNGEFTVKSDAGITLNILNEVGQLVKTVSLNDSNAYSVQVSDLSNGIYFIVGSNENGAVKQKMIVNK